MFTRLTTNDVHGIASHTAILKRQKYYFHKRQSSFELQMTGLMASSSFSPNGLLQFRPFCRLKSLEFPFPVKEEKTDFVTQFVAAGSHGHRGPNGECVGKDQLLAHLFLTCQVQGSNTRH